MHTGLRFLGVCGFVGLALNVSAAADNGTDTGRFLLDNAGSRVVQSSSLGEYDAQPSSIPAWADDNADAPKKPSSRPAAAKSSMRPVSPSVAESTSTSRMKSAPAPIPGVKNLHRQLFGNQPQAEPVSEPAESTANSMPLRSAKISQTSHQATTDSPAPTASMAAAGKRDLIHAEYQRSRTASTRDEIRQVQAQQELRSPEAPVASDATNAAPMPALESLEFGKPAVESKPSDDGNPFARLAKEQKEESPVATGPEPRVTKLSKIEEPKVETRMRVLPSVQPRAAQQQQQKPEQRHPLAVDARTPMQPVPDEISEQPSAETSTRTSETDTRIPNVTARWIKYSDVNVGQECELGLIVKNTGESAANNIVIDAVFPASVRVIKADPQPTESTDHLSWAVATLKPDEEQTIRIHCIPGARGELATSANVRSTGSAAGVFQVEEPILHVEIEGPQEAVAGELASQTVILSNPGSGMATNVSIEARIPEGLEHPRGQRLMMEIGSVAPKESRVVRLPLAAITGGTHTIVVDVKADAGLAQTASRDVVVIAPSIKVAVDGPNLRYIGRNGEYSIVVVNDGTGPANNVRVVHQLPEGFKFNRADKGGKFDPSHNAVGWFLGRLEPGQSAAVHAELTAGEPGQFVHKIAASSEHSAKSEAEFPTQVEGTAALVLEIVDLNDPVEVGSETAYEIRIKNEGTSAAKQVRLSCELPPAVDLLDAKGPAQHVSENGMVVFKELPQLETGKTAIYRVHVKGRVAGNHRFRARLTSDSNEEPLIFEELTKFYGDQRQ